MHRMKETQEKDLQEEWLAFVRNALLHSDFSEQTVEIILQFSVISYPCFEGRYYLHNDVRTPTLQMKGFDASLSREFRGVSLKIDKEGKWEVIKMVYTEVPTWGGKTVQQGKWQKCASGELRMGDFGGNRTEVWLYRKKWGMWYGLPCVWEFHEFEKEAKKLVVTKTTRTRWGGVKRQTEWVDYMKTTRESLLYSTEFTVDQFCAFFDVEYGNYPDGVPRRKLKEVGWRLQNHFR